MDANINEKLERIPSFMGVYTMKKRVKKVNNVHIETEEDKLYKLGKFLIKSDESDKFKQFHLMENAIQNNCEAVLIISKSTHSAGCISMHVARNIGYISKILDTINPESTFQRALNLHVYGKLYIILLDDDMFIDLPQSTLNKFFGILRDEKYPYHFTSFDMNNNKEFISRLGGMNKSVFPYIEQLE